MIIVDVNVVAYLLIHGERTEAAHRVLMKDSDWWTPPIWRYEYMNLLSNYVRFKGMPLETAVSLWGLAGRLSCLRESPVVEEKSLRLSIEKGISLYDAQYLSLAESLDAVLVSGDKALCKAVPDRICFLEDFAKEGPC